MVRAVEARLNEDVTPHTGRVCHCAQMLQCGQPCCVGPALCLRERHRRTDNMDVAVRNFVSERVGHPLQITHLSDWDGTDYSRVSRPICSPIAAVKAFVPSWPPRSLVRRPGSFSTSSTARSIMRAPLASGSFPCFRASQSSNSAAERINDVGLALSWPEMSGAEPCCAWAMQCKSPALIEAPKPRLPDSSDASSDKMSPNMLVVTITSNRSASRTKRAAIESTSCSSYQKSE